MPAQRGHEGGFLPRRRLGQGLGIGDGLDSVDWLSQESAKQLKPTLTLFWQGFRMMSFVAKGERVNCFVAREIASMLSPVAGKRKTGSGFDDRCQRSRLRSKILSKQGASEPGNLAKSWYLEGDATL